MDKVAEKIQSLYVMANFSDYRTTQTTRNKFDGFGYFHMINKDKHEIKISYFNGKLTITEYDFSLGFANINNTFDTRETQLEALEKIQKSLLEKIER